MAKLSANEFVEKHARRLKGATEDIRKGVEKVDESPGKKAADKVEKMRANLIKAFDSGKVERNLKAVDLADWKKDFIDKGLRAIGPGIDRAKGKMNDFANWLLPKIDSAKTKVDDMPDLTLDDNISRMETFVREMAKEKYK